jgi:hypothetical protein
MLEWLRRADQAFRQRESVRWVAALGLVNLVVFAIIGGVGSTLGGDADPHFILKMLVFAGLPINALIVWLMLRLMHHAPGIYLRPGGQAQNSFSQERAMAKNGDREGAIKKLFGDYELTKDANALRVGLELAMTPPQINQQAQFACRRLLEQQDLNRTERDYLNQLLPTLFS